MSWCREKDGRAVLLFYLPAPESEHGHLAETQIGRLITERLEAADIACFGA